MSKKAKARTPKTQDGYVPEYVTPYPAYQQPLPPPYPAYQQPLPPLAPDDMHTVAVTVLSSSGATVAKVVYASVYNYSASVSATGYAKREPGDAYDEETGRYLATSRALENLARKLRKRADSRIRSADAIRRHRVLIRNRPPREPRPGEVMVSFRLGSLGSARIPPQRASASGSHGHGSSSESRQEEADQA